LERAEDKELPDDRRKKTDDSGRTETKGGGQIEGRVLITD